MDRGNFKKLNKYHVIFLAQNIMIGIGLFTLPTDISKVGYNQWLVPIFLGILANLSLIPIIFLCQKYPNDTLFKMNENILGSFIGKGLNTLLLIYAVVQISSVSETYLKLVQTITLPHFTMLETSIVFFIVMINIVLGGIKSIARFCMFAFFFTSWLVYYTRWAFQGGNWLHAVPTFEVPLQDWLITLHSGAISMFGYGLILFYYPYIKDQRKAFLHTSIGIWIVVLFYVIVTLASVVYFSQWQLDHLKYPVLNLFQAVQLAFVERIENFGTTLWVFLVLSTASAYAWVAKKGMDALLTKHKNRNRHLYFVAIVSWFLFIGPVPYQVQVLLLDKWPVYYGYVFLSLPLILLLIHSIRERRKNGYERQA
ncbi:GerAB/ArcD/ProY family transporter [Bacillus solitudinis]|uniref:GerAB/ArcD/ProY family transporter n=1 Tax=Bacillus solitudinis TaxID=2014074 RepID=UPI000C24C5BB|nr:GerAB/ArcD/ProY family transporter [Bacillus solitudinis]